MADSFYKLSNPEFIIWFKTMLDAIENDNATAQIEQSLIDEGKTQRGVLATNLNEMQVLKDSLSGKSQEIKFNRQSLNKKASKIQTALKNNENITNSFIEQVGFNVDDGVKSPLVAFQPTDLVASGTSDGIHRLKFSRNGNKQGVIFIIEAQIGDSTEWIMIDAIKVAKYLHKNQTPGVKIRYRVRAKSGDSISSPSNIASLYE